MSVTGTPPQPARAVAPGGDRSGRSRRHPDEPAILLPRRRPGHLGPVHIMQLLLAEIVVVAVLATLTRGVVIVTVTAVAGVLLLIVVLGRKQGRWLLERRLMTRRYKRRRQGSGEYADDPRLAALRQLAPVIQVENVPVADGAQVGVARDDLGWYAVAAVNPRPAGRDDPGGLPLDLLAAALAEAEQPGAVLQVVTQTVPAPSIETPPDSLAAQSYRQLMARFGPTPMAADRATWIAIRLDGRSLAEAVPDPHADLHLVPAVVAALVRRVVKALSRAGVTHRMLDADALLDVLMRACDLDPAAPNRPAPREEWSEWHSSRLAHRSYWVRGWPPLQQASALLEWLSSAPPATTTVALIIAPEDGGRLADLRALVRVAAPMGELGQVSDMVVRGAKEAGADLFPLDGEQGPAVYASAPTGGGAR